MIFIRQATAPESSLVSQILLEAARWLEESGQRMWRDDELSPERIAADVQAGLFYLAELKGEPAGCLKFQLEDRLFWPDVRQEESVYIHRLAARRKFAGGIVSTSLLQGAAVRAQKLDRPFLRLDCEASRPKLRAVYEKFGFRHHSDQQVGPYFVSRYEYEIPVQDRG